MLKFTKKAIATALSVTMILGVTTSAMAAEKDVVDVQLNGKNITISGSSPQFYNGGVYGSFDGIFEALDASVAYDENTKKYLAEKNGVSVAYTEGESVFTVTKNGADTEIISFDSNQGMVPIRQSAEALEYKVGWDNAQNTVLLIDKNELALNTGKFTIMDKYLAFNKKFQESPMAVKGTFDVNYDFKESGQSLPITGTGTISGVTDSDKVNMNMNMSLDMIKFIEALGTEMSDAQSKLFSDMFSNIEMNFIMDITTGKYFINSPLLAQTTGVSENTWYSLDLNELMNMSGSEISFSNFAAIAKIDSFEAYTNSIIDMMPCTSVNDYDAMMESIGLFNKFFSDDAFKKDGNQYISSFSQTVDDVSVTMSMALMEENDQITGYSLDMDVKDSDIEMKVTASQNGSNTKMNMTMHMSDFISMVMNMDMDYSETTQTPAPTPPNGSNIVDLNKMILNTMPAVSSAGVIQ